MTVPIAPAEALARLAKGPDQEAWGALASAYADDAYHVAHRLTGDSQLAQDASQEALIHARLRAHSFRADPKRADAGARGWVLGIAAKAALHLQRAQGNIRRREHAAASERQREAPMPESIDEDEQSAVRTAITDLPEAHRRALLLRYVSGLDQEALAAELGCSAEAARVRVHRALERVRRLVARRGMGVPSAAISGYLSSSPPSPISGLAERIADAQALAPRIPPARLFPRMSVMTKLAWVAAASLAVASIIIAVPRSRAADGSTPPAPIPAAVDPAHAAPPAHYAWRPIDAGQALIGLPIGFDTAGTRCVLRLYDKRPGSSPILGSTFASADGADWTSVPGIAPYGTVIDVDGRLMQAQSTPDRKSWRIASIVNGRESSFVEISKHPDASYVHHTHITRTSDGVLHAIAGIYALDAADLGSHFEYVSSTDAGKTWSQPEQVFASEGLTAQDDPPSFMTSVGDRVYCWLGRSRQARKGKSPMVLMMGHRGSWSEAPMPGGTIVPASLRVDGGHLWIAYGALDGGTVSVKVARSHDGSDWREVATVADGLTAEDPILQLPIGFVVHQGHLLVSVCDSFGSWTKGEIAARIWASDDSGSSWHAVEPPEVSGNPVVLLNPTAIGDRIIALGMSGNFRNPKNTLWELVSGAP
jgi:RNA polymerase sigma factor (sigma-70 family)